MIMRISESFHVLMIKLSFKANQQLTIYIFIIDNKLIENRIVLNFGRDQVRIEILSKIFFN